MKKVLYFIIILIVIAGVTVIIRAKNDAQPTLGDMIIVESPLKDSVISSPITIKGQARGNWFFEASFPISIKSSDGKVLVQGHAEAKGDWMTTEYVPFEATLTFEVPANITGGSIILENDNPSGMESTQKALEIPVKFR